MKTKLLQAIKEKGFADSVIINGKFVNVASKEIYEGGVAVKDGFVLSIDNVKDYIGPQTKVIDAQGNYITPGFIDGHIHPESSNLSIKSFAEIILRHGTTSIMTDLHEIGVVSGLEGIEAVLEEGKETDLNIYFVVPSHVPFAPNLETSGGHFNFEVIKKALDRQDAVGLSEIVAPYLIGGLPDLVASMDETLARGKSCQGHLPDIVGTDLDYCIAAGVTTDHECLTTDQAIERVRKGCHLMMREGSAARNLKECIKVLTEHHVDSTLCSIVTDDLHTIDAVDRGDLDDALKTAIAEGVDFLTAVQMVTINAARAFHLEHEVGLLAPGARADICILDKESYAVKTTIAGGNLVYDHGEFLAHYMQKPHASCLLHTVHLSEFTSEDLAIKVSPEAKQAKVLAMRTLDWIPITVAQDATLPVKDGIVRCDVDQDVLYIAQVERYGINGNIGKGFIAGFNLKSGAMASSIAHDNHNIIVMGTDLDDMALALRHCQEMNGGQCLVDHGKVLADVAFPICGLLSDLSAEELSAKKKYMIKECHRLGSPIPIPFMFLSFIGLAAIPSYAITDKGFVDVMQQKVIDPILEVK
ncbi:MAG: amidohydrolase family protein [Spirochaetia bacterium]|jgi:adenine deaminase|nr:amidohydrolase family protein [Spirochaetia bacterium]